MYEFLGTTPSMVSGQKRNACLALGFLLSFYNIWTVSAEPTQTADPSSNAAVEALAEKEQIRCIPPDAREPKRAKDLLSWMQERGYDVYDETELNEKTICLCKEVKCDSQGQVIELTIEGTMPLAHLPPLPESLKKLVIFDLLSPSLPKLPNGKWYPSEVLELLQGRKVDRKEATPFLSLPRLPDSLTELYITERKLSSLPKLPNSLSVLFIEETNLSSLPKLPDSLTTLHVAKTKLSLLPKLPDSLLNLEVYGNPLRTLPELSSQLLMLNISGTQISSLPSLPSSLRELDFTDTRLSSLPDLPESLRGLYMGTIPIRTLPELPKNLVRFVAHTRNVTSLPDLPSGLEYLDLSHNRLTTLPAFSPSLKRINVSYNRLTCLPSLPPNLSMLIASHNKLETVPGPLPYTLRMLRLEQNPELHGELPADIVCTMLPTIYCGSPYEESHLFSAKGTLVKLPFCPQREHPRCDHF